MATKKAKPEPERSRGDVLRNKSFDLVDEVIENLSRASWEFEETLYVYADIYLCTPYDDKWDHCQRLKKLQKRIGKFLELAHMLDRFEGGPAFEEEPGRRAGLKTTSRKIT